MNGFSSKLFYKFSKMYWHISNSMVRLNYIKGRQYELPSKEENVMTTNKTYEEMVAEGFYKVSHEGGSFVTGTFYNPTTKESISVVLRDYDYADCSRDNDSLYNAQINEAVRCQWLHDNGVIVKGDTVEVYKGRKVPVGTIGTVVDIKPFYDRYGRWQADYVYFADGVRTNINNCRLVD